MWKLVDVQIIYKKLYQRELVTSDWFFVIRNNFGVQIFRNDETARQRHLPKMYTLVVTMNWNRFRKIFRIRFCIFYNRSELSQYMHYYVTLSLSLSLSLSLCLSPSLSSEREREGERERERERERVKLNFA